MKTKYKHIEDPILRKSMINRNRQYKSRYGITLEDYENMYSQQQGKCKLCQEEKRLVVEHNHENSKVRGLTCDRCNIFIGLLEKVSMEYIFKIHDYIYTDGKFENYVEEDDE